MNRQQYGQVPPPFRHPNEQQYYSESMQQQNMNMQPVPNSTMRSTPYDYFRKPEQPEHLFGSMNSNPSPTPSSPGIMNYFQNDNGEFDLDKVFAVTGQMSNLMQRTAPLIMRLVSFVKG